MLGMSNIASCWRHANESDSAGGLMERRLGGLSGERPRREAPFLPRSGFQVV